MLPAPPLTAAGTWTFNSDPSFALASLAVWMLLSHGVHVRISRTSSYTACHVFPSQPCGGCERRGRLQCPVDAVNLFLVPCSSVPPLPSGFGINRKLPVFKSLLPTMTHSPISDTFFYAFRTDQFFKHILEAVNHTLLTQGMLLRFVGRSSLKLLPWKGLPSFTGELAS